MRAHRRGECSLTKWRDLGRYAGTAHTEGRARCAVRYSTVTVRDRVLETKPSDTVIRFLTSLKKLAAFLKAGFYSMSYCNAFKTGDELFDEGYQECTHTHTFRVSASVWVGRYLRGVSGSCAQYLGQSNMLGVTFHQGSLVSIRYLVSILPFLDRGVKPSFFLQYDPGLA